MKFEADDGASDRVSESSEGASQQAPADDVPSWRRGSLAMPGWFSGSAPSNSSRRRSKASDGASDRVSESSEGASQQAPADDVPSWRRGSLAMPGWFSGSAPSNSSRR